MHGAETVTVAPKTLIPIRRVAPGNTTSAPNPITPAKAPPMEVRGDKESMESTLTDDTFDRHTDDDGSLSTLVSVNTHGLIQTDKVSSTSKAKFLRYKQKIKQEMKVTNLENIQEQLRLKAQVTALEAQLANQLLPGPSIDPSGPQDIG